VDLGSWGGPTTWTIQMGGPIGPVRTIAAAAEAAGPTVLHYDQDFDLVAKVTGQPCEWLVARESVP
jgi:hypothetical protein